MAIIKRQTILRSRYKSQKDLLISGFFFFRTASKKRATLSSTELSAVMERPTQQKGSISLLTQEMTYNNTSVPTLRL